MNPFWKTLERLRALPEHKKKLITFFGASICTLIIFSGWLVLTLSSFEKDKMAQGQGQNGLSDEMANVIGPWEAITTQMADIITNARRAISSIKNTTEQIEE